MGNILKNSKPETTPNISKQQLTAIRNLKQDPSITIVPAVVAVVIRNTVDYKEKISALLSNYNTYMKVTDKRRNPTSRVEKDLNRLLSRIKSCPSSHDHDKDQMDSKLYHYLHNTDATSASFYGLPKIHKADIPLRRNIWSPSYLRGLRRDRSKEQHRVCPAYNRPKDNRV